MNRFIRPLLFWILILSACSTSLPSTDAVPPVLPTSIATEAPAPTITTTASSDGGCGYQWAYKDLPDISSKFLYAIQQLQPSEQAKAFAFGEDCVYADGHADFIAMETDFNVTLQINDLGDSNKCGEWVTKISKSFLLFQKTRLLVRDQDG